MCKKTKTGIAALAFLGAFLLFGIAQNAKADYWTRYTRTDSGNVLPQYLELENMAKSSTGVRFLYGTDRKEMAGAGTDTHNLISFDGTNWVDQTSAVKNAAGYSDIDFKSMYSDSNGNVWMPNRGDPNRPLIRYNGATGVFEKIAPETIQSETGLSGGIRVNNLFTGPNGKIYAVASDADGHMYIIYYDGTWHNSGITGGALSNGADLDTFGVYSSANGGSFWLYKHGSSENEYSNGVDAGPGIWRYASGSWTQYDSTFATSNGSNFVNGITEAYADSAGKVWVGSRHGVFMYDGVNWVNWTKDNNNIFTNRVIKIQEDSTGRIWIICLENENLTDDNGGISMYNPTDGSWDYYTSYNGEDALNNATNIFMLGQGGDEVWMFTGHGEQAMSAGIYQLTRDSAHTAIYGQTAGTLVDKADFSQFKKKKTTSKNKAVTIYKMRKVKKKWKKSTRVYKGSTSQWYKVLNLDVGRYRVESKAKGKKKKTRTITITSGDPYRLDLR
jgi:hypothetical protein